MKSKNTRLVRSEHKKVVQRVKSGVRAGHKGRTSSRGGDYLHIQFHGADSSC